MSKTLERILILVGQKQIVISNHGYDELAADDILVKDLVAGIADAMVVEDYPDFAKGPCVLVRQLDGRNEAVHVVWGIPKGRSSPAVLVTAYKPDPKLWSSDFLRRA